MKVDEQIFERVSSLLRETPESSEVEISQENKLRFYGLYKHVQSGPCESKPPSILQVRAYHKHRAYASCSGLSKHEAMREYVELAASMDNPLGSNVKQILDVYNDEDVSAASKEQQPANEARQMGAPTEPIKKPAGSELSGSEKVNVPVKLTSRKEHDARDGGFPSIFSVVRPLVPRGQLDVAFSDLMYAFWRCGIDFTQPTAPSFDKWQGRIQSKWKQRCDHSVVVGLAARSVLDLYLTAKSFPSGSEIVVSPPINVPGMLSVLEYHGIKLVGVDVGPLKDEADPIITVDVEGITAALTVRTVAILVVHPFGIISTNEKEMKDLRTIADMNDLEIIEDCAQVFTGLDNTSYIGSDSADLRLFSFGLIKTSTAIGGGIGLVRDPELASSMNRLQTGVYDEQKTSSYFFKVFKAVILYGFARSRWICGILYATLSWAGLDFDRFVTALIRGFSSQVSGPAYLGHVRRRPCPALLAVLDRRLNHAVFVSATVEERIDKCVRFSQKLPKSSHLKMLCSREPDQHTFWSYPVLAAAPAQLRIRLLETGVDATQGASQMKCVDSGCVNALGLMRNIVYLPIPTGLGLGDQDFDRIARSLEVSRRVGVDEGIPSKLSSRNHAVAAIPFGVNVLIGFGCFLLLSYRFGPHIVCVGWLAVCFSVSILSCIIVLTWIMGDYYINSSSTLAHNLHSFSGVLSLTKDAPDSGCTFDEITNRLPCLRLQENHTERRRVVLTGATGYVGSMILYDLLVNRKQLGVDQVFVICRPKKGLSATKRIENLLNSPMFSFIDENEKKTSVRVFSGDVVKPNAGIGTEDLSTLMNERVTHIIHAAASVSFTQSFAEAARSNITPALMLQELASRVPGNNCRFIHISTAFVHGSMTGGNDAPLGEDLFDLGVFDPAEIYESMVGTEYLASKAFNELEFPNTYTFSKSICEHLLLRNKGAQTVIIRPSIVGPSVSIPYEGWAGQKPSTLVAAAALYLSFQWNLWCFGKCQVPCIPVDVVARFVLTVGVSDVPVDEKNLASSSSSDETDCELSSEDGYGGVSAPSLGDRERSSAIDHRIFNATWSSNSPPGTNFTWLEYASIVTQTGCLVGHFERMPAYVGLLFSTRVLPWIQPTLAQFRTWHNIFVAAPVAFVEWALTRLGVESKRLKRLRPYLDLPVMFFPFMNSQFRFCSSLSPSSFDGNRYALLCVAAAHRFVAMRGKNKPLQLYGLQSKKLEQRSTLRNLVWSLSQPKGNLVVRFLGFLACGLCGVCFSEISVDISSFAASVACPKEGHTLLVFAPTHRSFLDFILMSLVIFSNPELHVDMPAIIAASEFGNLPLLGWLAQKAGAFFIRRKLGKVDSSIEILVRQLGDKKQSTTPALEVFIEGTRSRDRRFVRPRTGVLKALCNSGVRVIVVPVAISYDRVPEQENLVSESTGWAHARLSSTAAFSWLMKALCGRFRLGRVYIAAGKPVFVDNFCPTKSTELANEIQLRQKMLVSVSLYHVEAAARLLKVDSSSLSKEIENTCNYIDEADNLQVPDDPDELMAVMCQLLSMYRFPLDSFGAEWVEWLGASPGQPAPPLLSNGVRSLCKKAEGDIQRAYSQLKSAGFNHPSHSHVFQIAKSLDPVTPSQLLKAAISMRNASSPDDCSASTTGLPAHARQPQVELQSGEVLGFWGYAGSSFVAQNGRDGNIFVQMKSNRYDIAGKRLGKLIPFIERETGTHVDLNSQFSQTNEPPKVMSSCFSQDGESAGILRSCTQHISFCPLERIRHGSGHCQQDIFAIRKGVSFRVPDVVVWPESESQVTLLVDAAKEHGWCIIPFGGGTNVTQATRTPDEDIEPRPVISLDTTRLNKIIWLNEEDGLAHVEAGITGRDLFAELAKRGYTYGSAPDSYEFSTLGGWIATKASGMKRNTYGNIEDIVKNVRVIGSRGLLAHGLESQRTSWGRESSGLELTSFVMGSEGCIGVITSAVIRVWRLPETIDHDGIVFSDFDRGVRFMREVSRLGSDMPSSCRLLDNIHFRLGQVLRPDAEGTLEKLREILVLFAGRIALSGMDDEKVVCATVVYEGTDSAVSQQKRKISLLSRKYGGVNCGSSVGKRGYETTFMVAYLRDFAMSYQYLGESFETFVPWSKLHKVVSSTRRCILHEHSKRCLPGRPFVGCRVTQLYHEGACLYFYFCMSFQNVPSASDVFSEIEHLTRCEILKEGGSLSHHHGVGKVREEFLSEINSPGFMEATKAIKDSLDPENIFGARNGFFARNSSQSHPTVE